MRDIPHFFMIVLVSFVLIMIGTRYQVNGIQQDSAVTNINETLRTAVIANRDDSARLNEGTFKLNKEKFEKDFKQRVAGNNNFENDQNKLVFDYLETEEGYVKGVKVKIIGEKNTYQATSILDVAGD